MLFKDKVRFVNDRRKRKRNLKKSPRGKGDRGGEFAARSGNRGVAEGREEQRERGGRWKRCA